MKRTNSVSNTSDPQKNILFKVLLVCALMQAQSIRAAPPPTIEVEGKVVRVVDGDTLVFLSAAGRQMTLRLAGIDAPEKGMPFGDLARRRLINLLDSGVVTAHTTKADRYGRTVATVFIHGNDVNLALIKEGLAWHYKRYAREQTPGDADAYASSESEARERRVGLWQDESPVPPWLYRKCHKPSSGCNSAETTSHGREP